MINDQLLFEIDRYNIFDLMGLSTIPQKSREAMFIDMNALIWQRFINERLSQILSVNQIREVEEMMAQKKKFQEILAYISSKVTNFNELLADFSREVKIELIHQHFHTMFKEYSDDYDRTKSVEAREKIREKMELYARAIELLAQAKWNGLITLLKTANETITKTSEAEKQSFDQKKSLQTSL